MVVHVSDCVLLLRCCHATNYNLAVVETALKCAFPEEDKVTRQQANANRSDLRDRKLISLPGKKVGFSHFHSYKPSN